MKTTNNVNAIAANEAKAKINQDNYVFIDVRNEEGVNDQNRILGSVNIPLATLDSALDKASTHFNSIFESNKNFVFYCQGGGMSAKAAQRAVELGLQNVYNLTGGYMAWSN